MPFCWLRTLTPDVWSLISDTQTNSRSIPPEASSDTYMHGMAGLQYQNVRRHRTSDSTTANLPYHPVRQHIQRWRRTELKLRYFTFSLLSEQRWSLTIPNSTVANLRLRRTDPKTPILYPFPTFREAVEPKYTKPYGGKPAVKTDGASTSIL